MLALKTRDAVEASREVRIVGVCAARVKCLAL